MGIIEQVLMLKNHAERYARCGNWILADILKEAADTIESLSAKLQETNMEQKVVGEDYKKQIMDRFQKVD